MIEIRVDRGDMQKVVQRLTRYDKNAKRGVQREVSHSALAIQRMARQTLTQQKAVATGLLRARIFIRFTTDRLGAAIETGVKYAAKVERGQKPRTWPNVGDLMRWVMKKIVRSPRRAVRSATYLIGRKIFQKGTEAKPFMLPAANKEWPRFKRNIQKVLKMS